MAQSNLARNPFMLITEPEVVLAAIENSEHLARLTRHLCRPLDKPLLTGRPGAPAAAQAGAAAEDSDTDAETDADGDVEIDADIDADADADGDTVGSVDDAAETPD